MTNGEEVEITHMLTGFKIDGSERGTIKGEVSIMVSDIDIQFDPSIVMTVLPAMRTKLIRGSDGNTPRIKCVPIVLVSDQNEEVCPALAITKDPGCLKDDQ